MDAPGLPEGGNAVLYRLAYADAQQLRPYSQARWSQPPAQLLQQRLREQLGLRRAVLKADDGAAQARRIEANGEADARQKLAEAEAYRMDRVGKVNAEQMAREGALVTKHPLLIQKTLADKLSDKIQVIIAPPPTNGDFIGAALLGGNRNAQAGAAQAAAVADDATTTQAVEQ
jgi:hypothetical protein